MPTNISRLEHSKTAPTEVRNTKIECDCKNGAQQFPFPEDISAISASDRGVMTSKSLVTYVLGTLATGGLSLGPGENESVCKNFR